MTDQKSGNIKAPAGESQHTLRQQREPLLEAGGYRRKRLRPEDEEEDDMSASDDSVRTTDLQSLFR